MVQWLGHGAFTGVAQVQFLVGQLRSCKLRSAAKTNKQKSDSDLHLLFCDPGQFAYLLCTSDALPVKQELIIYAS